MNALSVAVGDLEDLQQSLGEVTTDVSLDLDTIAGNLADVLEVRTSPPVHTGFR